jgi:hypothetical protein
MSLIASSSPWINDDPAVAQRKRIATMKKPEVYFPPAANDTKTTKGTEEHEPTENHSRQAEYDPRSFFAGAAEPTENDNDTHLRNSRVTELVNKITSFPADNAGNGLADFAPPVRDLRNDSPPPKIYKPTIASTPFAPNPQQTTKLSGYRQSYETPPVMTTTGYAPRTSHNHDNGGHETKVMDRLSYAIHLLEEMKHEKTNNVAEEFVLYSLLGIFVIYLVDAFARTGKYTR